MNKTNKTFLVLSIALAICGRTTTNAQQATSTSLPIGFDVQTIETTSFTCTPVHPIKIGDKIPSMVSDDQTWSVDRVPLQVGSSQVQYPILGMLKCPYGLMGIYPAVLKAKVDIKAGEVLKADGYQIEAKRAVKAGDSFSVLMISDSILSVEESDAKPWFTAYKNHPKAKDPASDRAALVAAWQTENKQAGR